MDISNREGIHPLPQQHCLITASKIVRFLPGLSTIGGGVELFLKYAIIKEGRSPKAAQNPYYQYLHTKDAWRMAIIVIPVIGNLIIFIDWCIQRRKTAASATVPPNTTPSREAGLDKDALPNLSNPPYRTSQPASQRDESERKTTNEVENLIDQAYNLRFFKKSPRETFQLAHQAYTLNPKDLSAIHLLGDCYQNGIGVEPDLKRAEELFLAALTLNPDDLRTNTALGNLYFIYFSDSALHAKAIPFYKKASQLGDVYATVSLGIHHALGRGTPKNIQKAKEYFILAAQQSKEERSFPESFGHKDVTILTEYQKKYASPQVALQLALCHQLGYKTKKSTQEAIYWCGQAYAYANLNTPKLPNEPVVAERGVERLALLYRDTFKALQNSDRDIREIRRAHREERAKVEGMQKQKPENAAGQAKECFNQAIELLKTQRTNPETRKKMVTLFTKAANFDHPEAHRWLATFYLKGYAVTERNLSKGFTHAQKAYTLNNKDPQAILLLGKCYQMGWGVEVDGKKAQELFQEGFKIHKNHTGLQLALGDQLFINSMSSVSAIFSKDAVITAYQTAHDSGSIQATARLAVWYALKGEMQKAEEYFAQVKTRAATPGSHDFPYRSNPYTNSLTAVSLLEAEVESGNACPEAIMDLALCYQLGYKVPQDRSKARTLYAKVLWENNCFALFYYKVPKFAPSGIYNSR